MSAKLLLIDGLNLVRRLYEAIPGEDSRAKAEGALRTSLSAFRRTLDAHHPSHVLAAFDHGGATWRHEIYAPYHQKRPPMPEALRAALPELREELTRRGVPSLSPPGIEADDVIAALHGHWRQQIGNAPVVIVSTDKDLVSLVADGATVWNYFERDRAPWRDAAWIEKKFGVGPALMQDLLALAGDSSDNIAGVPGVGEKTAARWLRQFGSLDNVIANADAIAGKVGERLRENLGAVRLARQLVAFKTDMKLGLTWKDLRWYTKPSLALAS